MRAVVSCRSIGACIATNGSFISLNRVIPPTRSTFRTRPTSAAGRFSSNKSSVACDLCPVPRWTTPIAEADGSGGVVVGAMACESCLAGYYLANTLSGWGTPGTWGNYAGDAEADECDTRIEGGAADFHGRACCTCPEGAECP